MARTGTFRGGINIGQQMYGAWTDEVYLISKDGAATLYSTLAGTDYPWFASNAKAIPDIAVVTGNGAFIINTTAGAVQNYPDGDVSTPGVPTCCCGYLGYIFFGYNTGVLQVTGFNSLNINTLDQARTITNVDGVTDIFGYDGQIYALGPKSVEIWGEPINSLGFPLTRTGFNITPGLIGKYACAGWEQEWGQPPIYAAADGTVRQLRGYQSVPVSNTDVERDILAVDQSDYDKIIAFVYNTGGDSFWQLNLPSKTWVFHANESVWHERQSQYLTRSKLVNSVHMNDVWVVGDTESNAVYSMTEDEHTESGAELPAIMESGPVKEFPYGQRIARADFDFTGGVGIAASTLDHAVDPQVQIEASYDGGSSYIHSWNRKLGKQGNYDRKVFITNVGITGDEGIRFRWIISDPVHVGFLGGDVAITLNSK